MLRSTLFTLLPFAVGFSLSLTAVNAKADDSDFCDADDIYCEYPIGLNENEGRYIKIVATIEQFPYSYALTLCWDKDSSASIQQEDGEKVLGNSNFTYYICTNIEGTDCQLIGSQNLYVTKNESGHYVGTPNRYVFDLSVLKQSFPNCSIPFSNKAAHASKIKLGHVLVNR